MKKSFNSVLGLGIIVFTLLAVFTPSTFATETVTNAQMLDMCDRVTSFISSAGSIPNYIYTVSGGDTIVSAADFHYMMARWLRYYKNNGGVPPTVSIIRNIQGPANPTGVETANQIQQADILAKGQSVADFIDGSSQLPNFSTVDSISYTTKAFFSVFARTINWYQDNGALPNYATVAAVDEPPSGWMYGDSSATATPTNTPTPTSTPAYSWSKTLSVAYTEQPDGYTCGPTSLRMVMGYYGTWYSVTTIGNWMASYGDSPWYDGVARATIIAAAKHYGFSNAHQSTGLTNLKSCITSNIPVICHIQTVGGSYPCYYPSGTAAYSGSYGHYVVCAGLQADGSGNVLYFVINDPARYQYTKYTYSSFMSAWGDKSYYYVNIQ